MKRPTPSHETIAIAAKDLREALGISQRTAAKHLGISFVHLCNIERGNSLRSLKLLAKYRTMWGVDPYVLFVFRQVYGAGGLALSARTRVTVIRETRAHLEKLSSAGAKP